MSTTTRTLPNSNVNRQTAILHARETKGVVAPEDMAITPGVATRIDTLAVTYTVAIDKVHMALGDQVEKTDEKNHLMRITTVFEKDMIKALNTAINRSELTGDGLFSKKDRVYYTLSPEQDTLPKLTTEAEVMMWGMNILKGESARIAEGKTPIAQPSVAELNNWYQQFRDTNNEQTALKNAYDHAQEDLEALKPEADALVRDIWDDAENFYRHEDIESKRRDCREWGVIYITRESPQSSDLQGIVKEESGTPIRDVRVEIPSLGKFSETTIEGHYEFIDIPEGEYTVTFAKESYVTQIIEKVKVKYDKENILDVVLLVDLE